MALKRHELGSFRNVQAMGFGERDWVRSIFPEIRFGSALTVCFQWIRAKGPRSWDELGSFLAQSGVVGQQGLAVEPDGGSKLADLFVQTLIFPR